MKKDAPFPRRGFKSFASKSLTRPALRVEPPAKAAALPKASSIFIDDRPERPRPEADAPMELPPSAQEVMIGVNPHQSRQKDWQSSAQKAQKVAKRGLPAAFYYQNGQ